MIILTIAAPFVQVATGIIPLQQAEAQDPIIGPPPPASIPTTVGGTGNATITTPTGFPANSSVTTNSSTIPEPSITANGSDITNATLPGGDLLGNGTLPDGTFGNGTLVNGTLANGTLANGTAFPGDPFGAGTFPNASTTGSGDTGVADQTGGGGAGDAGVADQTGGGGAGGTDQFGGGLNETGLPDAGPTAPPPITTILSNNTGDSTNPNVAVSGSDLFVAWEDTTGGNREILLISSLDGQNFTTVRNVTQTAGDSLNARLAVSGSNVYLVWEDINGMGAGQIMFAKSSDGGDSFTSAKNLSNTTGDSTNPNVAVFGNNVYVVWEQVDTNSTSGSSNSEAMFTKSSDGGDSFASAKNLSNNTGDSTNPNVAVSRSHVYVVWEDDNAGDSEIILVRSTNNGVNFAPSRNISNSPGESFDPRIAISESNVYVVWVDYSLGNSTQSDIMLIRSTNRGENFASAENLSNSPGESADPRIAVSESNVYVVWEDTTSETGNSDVKFVRSADSGATFTSARNLSNNVGISFDPRVAVSGSNVYVVWEDTTSTTAEGSSDIFLARSTNNGATFGRVQNLSNNPVESFDPYIVASRSKLFVLWSDDKQGNAEVIFTDKTRNIASPEESAEGGVGGDQGLTGGTDLGIDPNTGLPLAGGTPGTDPNTGLPLAGGTPTFDPNAAQGQAGGTPTFDPNAATIPPT